MSLEVLKVNFELYLYCLIELSDLYVTIPSLPLSYSNYAWVINGSFIFGLKFIIIIMFLILIRGGTPRYRYDYLTKLGWLKFIGLTVSVFFSTLLLLLLL